MICAPACNSKTGVHARVLFHSASTDRRISQVPSKCSAQMWISRIEPDKPDHDKRTFECPACDGVMTAIVKYR